MVKPIRPDEVTSQKEKFFPREIIEAFNELIVKTFSDNEAKFKQEQVIALAIEKGIGSRSMIFRMEWLDVEDLYRAQGWTVTYDKPGYNETYPPTFTFRRS